MNTRPAPTTVTGTTTRTERIIRARYPDGRISDSQPIDVTNHPGVNDLAAAFGRLLLPKGTRIERLERTVTTTASEWVVKPEPATADTSQS